MAGIVRESIKLLYPIVPAISDVRLSIRPEPIDKIDIKEIIELNRILYKSDRHLSVHIDVASY